MPIDVPILLPILSIAYFPLSDEIPILIPKEIPIRKMVKNHTNTLLSLFEAFENPIDSHLIYYGGGALLTFTPLIGNSLSLQKFQKFEKDGGLLFA